MATSYVWIPASLQKFMELPKAEQNQAFKDWCVLWMAELTALGASAVLKFDPMSPPNMAECNIQGANVWVSVNGKALKTNVHVTFNSLLENDQPKQGDPRLRNDPKGTAERIIESAVYWENNPPSEGYGVLSWPSDPDIVAG